MGKFEQELNEAFGGTTYQQVVDELRQLPGVTISSNVDGMRFEHRPTPDLDAVLTVQRRRRSGADGAIIRARIYNVGEMEWTEDQFADGAYQRMIENVTKMLEWLGTFGERAKSAFGKNFSFQTKDKTISLWPRMSGDSVFIQVYSKPLKPVDVGDLSGDLPLADVFDEPTMMYHNWTHPTGLYNALKKIIPEREIPPEAKNVPGELQ